MRRTTPHHRPHGFLAAIIFVAVGLAIALSVAYSRVNANANANTTQLAVAQQVASQANLIRQAVVNCTLRYPQGGGSPLTVFPATPGDTLVRSLSCPGAPVGHQALWSGVEYVPLPPPPRGFGQWTYSNTGPLGSQTITISIALSSNLIGNPQYVAGLEQSLRQFSTQEAQCTAGGASFNVVIRAPSPTTYPTRCQ